MSSRIIRGDDRPSKLSVRSNVLDAEGGLPALAQEEQIARLERQAFEQGYREGERIGRQTGERMIETTVKHYENAAAGLASAHGALVKSVESKTVELALEIARKVIQREITIDPDLVTALAMVALRRVQSQPSVSLRVSRHDFARIREAVAAVNNAVTVVEDTSLERGDFMIDTAQTHLDGSIAGQVEALGRSMLSE